MSVTSHDVAKLAGVSRSTVSYILGGRGDRFTEATRQAVEEAAEKLGYHPQVAGRLLKTGRSDVVVFELTRVLSGIFVDGLAGLARDCAAEGIEILFQAGAPSDAQINTLIASLCPRAYVTLGTLTSKQERTLNRAGIRVVSLNFEAFDHEILRVQLECLGSREIAYVALKEAQGDVNLRNRLENFRQRCPGAPIIWVSLHDDGGAQDIAALPPSSGLACYNDDAAAVALRHLRQAGRSVPGDIAVVGADDAPVGRVVTPSLTTVAQALDPDSISKLLTILDEVDDGVIHLDGTTQVALVRRESA